MGSEHSRRFSVRFDLNREEHRIAWEKLREIPKGKRNEFMVQAILEKTRAHPLHAILERMERMENSMGNRESAEEKELKMDTGEITQNVLNFMKGL